jgi:NOL1/NOP2/fmu family ribosome biogenesis protein
VDLSADSEEVHNYLRGETLSLESAKGWVVITVDGYPLGWAKQAGGILKNHYPKGLRWLT